MKNILFLTICIIPILIFSNIALIDSISKEISSDSLYDILNKLSGEEPYPSGYYSYNRSCFSGDADSAAKYIKMKLDNYGLDSVFYQFYIDTMKEGYSSLICDTIFTSQNIIIYDKGTLSSDTCIVIGAHYDAISEPFNDINTKAPGADDNASGVAAISEIARIISPYEHEDDIYLVLFSGEEIGISGSIKFINEFIKPNNLYVKTMINIDMIGFYNNRRMTKLSGNYDYLKELGIMIYDTITNITPNPNDLITADNWAFELAGYDNIFFIEDEWGISPGLHNQIDSVSYIDSNFLYENVQASFAYLFYLSNCPEPIYLIQVIDNGDSSISLFWEPEEESDLMYYNVYYDYGNNQLRIDYIDSDSISYTIKNVFPDSVYTIYVTAVDTMEYESLKKYHLTCIPSYIPHEPSGIIARSDSINVYLNFLPIECMDLAYYNIYRKKEEYPYTLITSITDTFYTDSSIIDTFIYTYAVTAVDTSGLESGISEEAQSRLIKLSHFMLVIDETNNNALTTDNHCDAFYDSIFFNYNHRLIDADSINETDILLFGNYARTVIIDDDLSASKMDLESIEEYINNGGKLLILGWNLGAVITGQTGDNPVYTDSIDRSNYLFNIESYRYNVDYDMDYMNYNITGEDTLRFSSLKLPRGSGGNLNYSGIYGLKGGIELGYYHSVLGDTLFESKPIMYCNGDSSLISVNAPLFCMENNDAVKLVEDILSMWGVYSGVINGEANDRYKSISMMPIQNINIEFGVMGFKGEKVKCKLYDINGRQVYNTTFNISEETANVSIEEKLTSGIYFLKVKTNDYEQTFKTVLIR